MPVVLSGLGTVTPLATVTVKTQITGHLTEVAFKEGQLVNKGDFLAQIDPRPYQVALEQAAGPAGQRPGGAEERPGSTSPATTRWWRRTRSRGRPSTPRPRWSPQDRGTDQADQAQIDTQKLNLTYCHIVAPVDGRVGLRQVDPGNYVQTSDANGIVVITQTAADLGHLHAAGGQSAGGAEAAARRRRPCRRPPIDRTGTTKLDTGTLETIDNQIDPTTGTVKLRAIFDNPEEILFPNQFVNVKLLVDTLHDASIVPTAAIQRGAPGTFVYLVKPGDTVAAQPVTLGPERRPARRDPIGPAAGRQGRRPTAPTG